jgi:hypothetical protein
MSLWSPGQSGRRRRMAGREWALSRQINRYSTPLDGQRNGCLIDHIGGSRVVVVARAVALRNHLRAKWTVCVQSSHE